MAALSPRLKWALIAVLGLTLVMALQPGDGDDLAVSGNERAPVPPPRAAVGDAREVAAPARRGAQPRAAPTAEQARELAWLAAAWRGRTASRPATLAPSVPAGPGPWASQQPPPPPPPPPVAVVEAAPQAPRFPYNWVGRYVDDVPRAVISGPAQTWVLRRGDVLEGQWRVESIADRQMTLMYLPLNQSQSVGLK